MQVYPCFQKITLINLLILEQTKRHIQILDFLQIKNVIFALNKIDLIKYNHKNYLQILNELKEYIFEFKFSNPFFVPVSALQGINIVKNSSKKNGRFSPIFIQPWNPLGSFV